MIPLASISGQFVFLAVFAVVGFINWWAEQKKKKGAGSGPSQPPASPQRPISTGGGSDSEQERLRRFLEALGVPQQQQPPQQAQPQPQFRPQPAPQPVRRQPVQASLPHPVQRQIAQNIEQRMQGTKPPRQIVRKPKPVVREQEEFAEAGRLEEAASSIESISGAFDAMNVQVTMQPLESTAHLATSKAGTTSVLEREGNPLVASLHRTLTTPADIRAAFLAAELLGPPRSLQG